MVNPERKVQELPLSPEEFFVLSRIDGKATVADVLLASGLGSESTERILARLMKLDAVRLVDGSQGKVEQASSSSTQLRLQARERRLATLRTQLGGTVPPAGSTGRGTNSSGTREMTREMPAVSGRSTREMPRTAAEVTRELATRTSDSTREKSPSASRSHPERPMADADDPRIDTELDLEPDEQRYLLGLHDNLAKLTHFEILQMFPSQDARDVRRGYHEASRVLHPDAYFGKSIGPYQTLLDDLFKRAKASYETLMNDAQRSQYIESLLEAERKQDSLREAEQAIQRALEAEQDALTHAEAHARRERDEERVRKRMDRLNPLTIRRAKARDHYEQAVVATRAGDSTRAANLLRLAVALAPDEALYRDLWQQNLAMARQLRAQQCFERGKRAEEFGQTAEAAQWYIEAAQAHPTAIHLAHAAGSVAQQDPATARNLALEALEQMRAAENRGEKFSDEQAARIHMFAARAFRAAGQLASARQQADLASKRQPDDPAVRALLNAMKVP